MKTKRLVLVGLLLAVGYVTWVVVWNVQHKPQVRVAANYTSVTTPVTHPVVSELFTEVNDERVNAGLAPLVEDPRLDASAMAKCLDMVALDYWTHDRPDGTPPWHFFYEQGIPQGHIGENQARGYNDAKSLVTGWMNSPGHRANILDPTFNHVGYGVCFSKLFTGEAPSDIAVQHFTD